MQGATLTRPGTRRVGPVWLTRLRTVPAATWAKLGFAALCVGALVGYLAFPTYPTYDTYYALIWGRDVLHLHVPVFQVYRAPTEHPLAIAFGVFAALFGQAGDRVMILGAIASFVALVAGLYRLGRLTFGPLVGAIAALILCTRFDYESLAAQGYLDFSYMALVVWAGALEAARPRRGALVFGLLAAAGLLRPDAWLLAGVYFLWCAWPTVRAWSQARELPKHAWRTLVGYAALTVAGTAAVGAGGPRGHGRSGLLAALHGGPGGTVGQDAGHFQHPGRGVGIHGALGQAAAGARRHRGGDPVAAADPQARAGAAGVAALWPVDVPPPRARRARR